MRPHAKANGTRDSRHRIEHIELIDPADIPRLKQLGVVASLQPVTGADVPGNPLEPILSRVGDKLPYAYAWQLLRNAGAVVAFSSDWPIAPSNPFLGMQAAMTAKPLRRDCTSQAQGLMDTLHAFTAAGAYMEFMEDRKGMLKEGYLADVVVLDADMERTPADAIASGAASVNDLRWPGDLRAVRIPLPRRERVFTSFRREAIEMAGTTGFHQRLLAAAGRTVRRIPRCHVARVLEADAVMMADDGRAFAVARPVLAGRVAARRRIHALRIRPGQHVVLVGFVAAALDHLALLGERGLLGDIGLVGMQFIDRIGDDNALDVLPRALADPVARIDAGLALRRRGAEIGFPVGLGRTRRLGQCRAMGISPLETAEIGAIAFAHAGDEETHSRPHRPRPCQPLRLLSHRGRLAVRTQFFEHVDLPHLGPRGPTVGTFQSADLVPSQEVHRLL